MKRITWRDHLAVVMRCTATNTTPAVERAAKNSQLAWKELHARSGARIAPATNTSAPMTARMTKIVLRAPGRGLLDASSTSSRVGTRGGCRLTGVVSGSMYRLRRGRASCLQRCRVQRGWTRSHLDLPARRQSYRPAGTRDDSMAPDAS